MFRSNQKRRRNYECLGVNRRYMARNKFKDVQTLMLKKKTHTSKDVKF